MRKRAVAGTGAGPEAFEHVRGNARRGAPHLRPITRKLLSPEGPKRRAKQKTPIHRGIEVLSLCLGHAFPHSLAIPAGQQPKALIP